MQKAAPSIPRIFAMVVFALSCFGILLFLWLAFGGSIPMKPQGYRFKATFPEATTLAEEADVRIAGVNVGRVKKKSLIKSGARTLIEMEIDAPYAPIPKDSRAMLRQKTLLGETFVELTPGSRTTDDLPEGGTLARANVEETVELDEIFRIFDPKTKRDFRTWVRELARASESGTGEDFNDALGNLPGFAEEGADVLRVLDEQERAVRLLIRNTGRVFGALNRREGELRQLIVNSNETFEATASQKEALAETFEIFPTFLDESRALLARLETFSIDTRPLVIDLKPVADDLGPTVRDVGALSPDLERLFRDLDPLITESRRNLPQAARFLRGARPVFRGLHRFLPELNPILSFANFYQGQVGDFLQNGAGGFGFLLNERGRNEGPVHELAQLAILNDRSLTLRNQRPPYERGNAYLAPNFGERGQPLGAFESFDCRPSGIQRDPVREHGTAPPCFVAPPSLFSNRQYTRLRRGQVPSLTRLSPPSGRPPHGTLRGTRPARP